MAKKKSVEEGEGDSTDQDAVLQRNALEIQTAACAARLLLCAIQGAARYPTALF